MCELSMDGQPLHCVTHSAERQTGSLGELARTLLSFKRPTLAIELQQFRILAIFTWGRVTPNAYSPRVLSRMS